MVKLATNASRITEAFRELAGEKDSGRIMGPTSYPSVRFKQRGVEFVVRTVPDKKQTIRVYAPWPEPDFRVTLLPETISDDLKRFIGMQDIKIGSREFDARFVIQSSDVERVVKFLTPEVQSAIMSLGPETTLHLVNGQARLEKKVDLHRTTGFNDVVNDFVAAYFLMRDDVGNSSSSISVMAVNLAQTEATCMVCGEVVSDRKVYCRSCDTPHHQECWEYLGQCSTYGCGQKKWRAKNRFVIE